MVRGARGSLLQCGSRRLDRSENQGHAIVIEEMPGARLLERASQRRVRGEQNGLDAVITQVPLPACLSAHGLHVFAGELRTIKVAAAIDEDTAAGVLAVNKIPAPKILRENAAVEARLLQLGRRGDGKRFRIVNSTAGGRWLGSVE